MIISDELNNYNTALKFDSVLTDQNVSCFQTKLFTSKTERNNNEKLTESD